MTHLGKMDDIKDCNYHVNVIISYIIKILSTLSFMQYNVDNQQKSEWQFKWHQLYLFPNYISKFCSPFTFRGLILKTSKTECFWLQTNIMKFVQGS